MNRKALVAGLCAVLLGSAGLAAQTAQATKPEATLIDQARKAYQERADPARAKEAMALFSRASEADPKSYEARWEGAKACYFYGNYTKEKARDKEKMAIFQDGIDRAKAAVALKADGVEGHFWLGVLYGVYGEAKGIFKSLAMVPDIKKEMKTCMDLDPSVEAYGPDRVLGRMYYKLPWFKGGDNDKSIKHLEASLKGEPNDDLTRLYLAQVYKSEGMKAKAVSQLHAILDKEPDPRWKAEYPSIRARAQKLLKKLT